MTDRNDAPQAENPEDQPASAGERSQPVPDSARESSEQLAQDRQRDSSFGGEVQ
jgi:hypothetical protein